MALTYDVNVVCNNGAAAIYRLVQRLVSAGGSIYAHGNGSDGRVVGAGSGGTAFAAAKLLDTADAWVEVTLPGSAGTLGIQRGNQSAGTNTHWWIRWSGAAQSTSGGSGTAMDAFLTLDSNAVNIFGTGSGGSAVQAFPADDAVIGWRLHVAGYDASPYGMWLSVHDIGTGRVRTALAIDPVAVHASDTVPYVFLAQYRQDGVDVCLFEALHNTNTSRVYTRERHGLSGAVTTPCVAATLSWNGGTISPRNLALNPYDSKDELDFVNWYTDHDSARRRKGTSQMIAWAGYDRPSGHTFNPDGTSDDRFCVGDITFPWPGGVAADV